jgi:SNF2 family DNA or RNA helicase
VSASLPWTSADLLQCEDRLQRIGQKRDVVSHIMLSAIEEHSTIDERMIQIIMMKNRILSSVLDGEADDLLDDERKAVAMLVLESYGWEG